MAAAKKPRSSSGSRSTKSSASRSNGSRSNRSSSSGGTARKPRAKRTASGTARKSTTKRATASSRKAPAKTAGKTPAKTARKTAPKSGSKAEAKAAAAAVPEIAVPPRRAADVKAVSTTPSLRPGRRRSVGRWAAVAGLLAAIVVVIVLIASGGSDDNNNTNVAATTPTATTPTPTATAPSATPPAAVAPAAKPVVRTQRCDPIVGTGYVNGGRSYDVTSSAKDGDPAGCTEAHSVVLSALSGQATTVGDWTCKTNPGAATVATCTSAGGRSIQARG
jgi:hypothetical protein